MFNYYGYNDSRSFSGGKRNEEDYSSKSFKWSIKNIQKAYYTVNSVEITEWKRYLALMFSLIPIALGLDWHLQEI